MSVAPPRVEIKATRTSPFHTVATWHALRLPSPFGFARFRDRALGVNPMTSFWTSERRKESCVRSQGEALQVVKGRKKGLARRRLKNGLTVF
eukprot:3613774-Pleurochrysis_carterae.AAC.1